MESLETCSGFAWLTSAIKLRGWRGFVHCGLLYYDLFFYNKNNLGVWVYGVVSFEKRK